MKKLFIRNMALAITLLAGLVLFSACSSDDDDVVKEKKTVEETTYTLTINAVRGNSEAKARATRALSIDGGTLAATWKKDEEVKVYFSETDELLGSVYAQSDGESTILTGTLKGMIWAHGNLKFEYSTPNYESQTGTFEHIEENCDYATAAVKIDSIHEGQIMTTGDVSFRSHQTIMKLMLKAVANNLGQPINPTDITIQVEGMRKLVLTDIPAATYENELNGDGVLYLAMPGFAHRNITLTATAGEDTYTVDKKDVTCSDGTFNTIEADMWRRIDLAKQTDECVAMDGDLLTGELNKSARITIAPGATVRLRGVSTSALSVGCDWPGINCVGDATLILEEGNDIVSGGNEQGECNYPGILIAENHTLTIEGDGWLTANSFGDNCTDYGAGIGGGPNIDCGNIVIKGGHINVWGGQKAAGIGSGAGRKCGNITISGGTLEINGLNGNAAIGAGAGGECGNIIISGGTIESAYASEDAAGIGSGKDGSVCGNITIRGGAIENTTAFNAAGIGSGKNGSACGNILISSGSVQSNGIGAGMNSKCKNITITSRVTLVESTVDWGDYSSIGKRFNNGECGTVTIGGEVYDDGVKSCYFTYEP